jgi:hypothetical protein
MQCAVCGTELERPGQGHTCRPLEPAAIAPPKAWVVATWVVLGFAVLYVACALLVGRVTYSASTDGKIDPDRAAGIAGVSFLWFVVLVGTVIAQVRWNRRTKQLAEQYGFAGNLVIRAWFVRVYAATIVLTVFLGPLLQLTYREGSATC